MRSFPQNCRRPSARGAFTLIELLVVMAIILTLVGLAVPALNSIGKSSALASAGSQVVNLANLARQTAMSHNSMTALIFKDAQAGSLSQGFALYELTPRADGTAPVSSDWKQVGNWEPVPVGVVVYKSLLQDPTANGGGSSAPNPAFPPLKYNGTSLTAYKYAVFLPTGNLLNDAPTAVQMAEGTATAPGSFIYTRRASGGSPASVYTVSIIAATGRTHADRTTPPSS